MKEVASEFNRLTSLEFIFVLSSKNVIYIYKTHDDLFFQWGTAESNMHRDPKRLNDQHQGKFSADGSWWTKLVYSLALWHDSQCLNGKGNSPSCWTPHNSSYSAVQKYKQVNDTTIMYWATLKLHKQLMRRGYRFVLYWKRWLSSTKCGAQSVIQVYSLWYLLHLWPVNQWADEMSVSTCSVFVTNTEQQFPVSPDKNIFQTL